MPRLTMTHRVVLLALTVSALFACVTAWMIRDVGHELTAVQADTPKAVAQAAASLVERYVALAKAGTLSEADAKQQALAQLRALRFEGTNYVWVNDLHPTMVMHPFKPELDGKDLTGTADPDGVHLFVEMAKVVQASPTGEGEVSYRWPKPGAQAPVRKVSAVKLVPAWGWVVGAGAYLDDVEATTSQLTTKFIVIEVLALLACMVTAWVLGRRLTLPLERSLAVLEGGAAAVASTAGAVASVSQRLTTGAQASASALTQISTAVDAVAAGTRNTTDRASQARGLTERTAMTYETANQSLTQAVDHMGRVTETGREVARIVKVINDIAFQTNLLALNAGVEAARAGSAGAGFAVVAGEVRTLAQKVTESAKQTNALIDRTVQELDEGKERVERVRTDFEQVGVIAQQLAGLVAEISSDAEGQASQLSEVGGGLSALGTTAQQNADGAETMATAAQSLTGESAALQRSVDELHELFGGDEAAATSRTAPRA